MPEDVETIKKHIVQRNEAIEVCLRENTLLSEKLRQKIGPVAWLEWMQEQKDLQSAIVADFIKKQQQEAKQ
jgi:hypothetical protein